MKKLLMVVCLLIFTSLRLISGVASAEETTEPELAQVVVQQDLILEIPQENITNEEQEELIKMYEQAGWLLDGSTLVKPVTQSNVEVNIEDERYLTDDSGTVYVPVENKEGGETVELTVEGEANTKETQLVDIAAGQDTVIFQSINVSQLMDSMDNQEVVPPGETSDEENGFVSAGGVSYSNGDSVHCNRFNGYLGDGKYYNKKDHPFLAVRNFAQSDCDIAVARSRDCDKDYGSNPYCATNPVDKRGKCSTKSSHSKKYHKHTGWYSPSS